MLERENANVVDIFHKTHKAPNFFIQPRQTTHPVFSLLFKKEKRTASQKRTRAKIIVITQFLRSFLNFDETIFEFIKRDKKSFSIHTNFLLLLPVIEKS